MIERVRIHIKLKYILYIEKMIINMTNNSPSVSIYIYKKKMHK